MTRDDLIWLAGLCEGEACFDLHKGRYPRIRIGMTDRDVVGRVATLLGANIRWSAPEPPFNAMFYAEISGVRAAVIMAQLLPHMGSRRSGKIATILGHANYTPTSIGEAGSRLTRPPALR